MKKERVIIENITNQLKINVIDSPCGSGKTQFAIQMMNEDTDATKRFIYITPFLDEVKRVKMSVKTRKFHEPQQRGQGKLHSLKQLIVDNKDIVSTHALFQMADEELIDLLKSNNYTLILDEVMNVIEQFKTNKNDFQYLLDKKSIEIDDDGYVVWIEDEKYADTRFNEIKNLANNRNLIINRNSILMWTFPIRCFEAFEEVYILTYMFNAQYQRYYYDMHKLEYTYYAVELNKESNTYKLVEYDKRKENVLRFKEMINIYEGKMNIVGKYSMSSTWFKDIDKNEKIINQLQNNVYNYFTNVVKGKSKSNMWTTLLHAKPLLKGKGYTKGFIPHNARATNEFSHKTNLAYIMNKYMMPLEKGYFEDKGIKVNQDAWTLSELIQWIWRSAIRNGKPINLYIPSKRMRDILEDWLNEVDIEQIQSQK